VNLFIFLEYLTQNKIQKKYKMKKIIILLVVILLQINLFSQAKTALFIGNSYTFVNNLPGLINSCANSVGDTLIHQSHTPGGAQLIQHASNPAAISAINSRNWDYLVLQEQSQKPSFGQASVVANVYPYAKTLCDTARANYECIMPVFFMTWGRKFGDAGNCPTAPWLCTYNGMDSALAKSYREMGNLNNAYVSPVGAVWHYLIDNYPSLNLYSSDNSHPSLAGSYAAACTFYTIFWQKDPTLITYNSTVTASVAHNIRNAVKLVCYDSLAKWNIGKFNPTASFTFSIVSNNVSFSNSSASDSSFWDFGDGNISTSKNPSHSYSTSGNFIVTLISGNCFKDTITDTITIAPLGIKEHNNSNSIEIYPNPSSGIFMFKGMEINTRIEVYSMEGKLVSQTISKKNVLDLSFLKKGTYTVRFRNNNVSFAKKISIK